MASVVFDGAELDVGMPVLSVVFQKFGEKVAEACFRAFLSGLSGKNDSNGNFRCFRRVPVIARWFSCCFGWVFFKCVLGLIVEVILDGGGIRLGSGAILAGGGGLGHCRWF